MTKTFLILIAAGVIGFSARAQHSQDAPDAAKTAFAESFPGITANWDREGENYEVNFKHHGRAMSMLIDKNGTIVETETSVHISELPQPVLEYVKGHYAGRGIREAARIVRANGDVWYEAELSHSDIVFDVNGKFLKETKD